MTFMRRTGLALSGLVLGVIAAAVFVANRQSPDRDEAAAAVPTLTVIEARRVPFRLEARGYGVVRPAETWQAVANVPGRVVERHPGLESGTLLPKGTLVLVLDPSRYELAIAEAEAELASLRAEQAQLDEEQRNTARLLELERDRLDLAEQELERMESLVETDAVSRSRRDEQRRVTLAQRQAVASLENQLAVMPSRIEQLRAQADRTGTRLAQAREDLEDTRFEAPYDVRIRDVEIELHQNAGAGQRLFTADSIEAAEIPAHVPLPMARRLMGGVRHAAPPSDALDIGERVDFSAIAAEVALAGAAEVVWPGRVTRVASGLDPETRTVRIVVTVDAPYEGAAPPERPALQPGMYVQARLSAPSREPLLVVPASAVQQGAVHVVDEEERLARRPVHVAFEQRDLAVIDDGLEPGERVIVDDPGPVFEGMAVHARRDETLENQLRAAAEGRDRAP